MPFKKKDNRRSASRISICRLVKIRFSNAASPAKLTNVFDLSESGMRLHVTDISDTGFQLSVPGLEPGDVNLKALSDLKKGDTLFFRLNLDPQHAEIPILGRLAWIKREDKKSGARVRAGIQFVDISDADKKLIQVYVSVFKND